MKFKEIEGYPNYLIYEDGRVWSKPRTKSKGGYRKINLNKYNYYRIQLSRDGQNKIFSLHRLLAIHFIPNPEDKPCVDHIDGIRTNNKLSNLRWVTHRENNQNMLKSKGVTYYKGNNRWGNKRWTAYWFEDGKYKSKRFLTEDEAISYRQAMVDIYYNRPINT